jgi:myo-inositol-1(or 4)-monophosphatase
MPDMWEKESEVAEAAAKVGGAVAAGHFRGGIEAVVKNAAGDPGTYNMVTQADLDGERAIVEEIRRTFPGHAVLGEELHGGGDETAATLASEHLWIIDPIDGTSNFVHGIPHFGVSVAYYHRGVAACGVVGNPITDDWFTAVRGRGAYHNGRRATVSPCRRIDEILVGFGYYYDRGAMMEASLDVARETLRRNSHGIRRMGAATLDLAYVGIGSFGAFFEYELSPWDFAAGRLFVEEAGGQVTTCHGDPLPLAKTSLLASNGLVHDEMVKMLDHAFRRD